VNIVTPIANITASGVNSDRAFISSPCTCSSIFKDQIPTPDLIILDENLKAGLLLEDTCTELQIKSVLKVVDDTDANLIKHLLNIIQQISTQLVDTGGHPMIINGRKLTEASNQETTIIELLAKRMNTTDEDVIARPDFSFKQPRQPVQTAPVPAGNRYECH
jgi:hypothetical protein